MSATPDRGYLHAALFYESDAELVATAVPFLREGLAEGDAVVLVSDDQKADLLAEALGGDERVSFFRRAHKRASVAIATFRRMVEDQLAAGARRVRLVGDVPRADDPDTVAEWTRFEAVINHALATYPLWSVCAYDTRLLRHDVLTVGHRTHPDLFTGSACTGNARYVQPVTYLRQLAPSGSDPLRAEVPAFDSGDLVERSQIGELRADLRTALGAAVPGATLGDLVTAVGEIATNGLTHGRPPVRVRAWASTRRLLCRVTDQGDGFDDPLAGYLPNPLHSGRGLWLARQLCDRVEAFPAHDGFTVQMATAIPLADDPAYTALAAGVRGEVATHRTTNARARAAELLSRFDRHQAARNAIQDRGRGAAQTLWRLHEDAAARQRNAAHRKQALTNPDDARLPGPPGDLADPD